MNEIESYTPNMRHHGRYRMRTWLRGHALRQLTRLLPKGARDCGSHEWYRQGEQTDACYHCDPGARPHQPLNVPVDLELRAGLTESAARGNEPPRPRWLSWRQTIASSGACRHAPARCADQAKR